MDNLPNIPGAPPDLMGLAQVAQRVPGRPSANVLSRWIHRGVLARDGTRIRLKYIRLGGRFLTSPTWVIEFGEALAAADQRFYAARDSAGENLPVRDPSFATNGRKSQRAARIATRRSAASKSIHDAYRELDEEGL